MPANKVWVRGVVGRLARIEPRGEYLAVDRWVPTSDSRMIQRKAAQGDLELTRTNPNPKPKKAEAAAPAWEGKNKEPK